MKTNLKDPELIRRTHGGAPARKITPEQELVRSTASALLWEDLFYESGQSLSERVAELVSKCDPEFTRKWAITLRSQFDIRHMPMFICVQLAKINRLDWQTVEAVVQRADELSEFLAIYWKVNGADKPIANSIKKGLAKAFDKFDEYNLAKYNGGTPSVRLKDVLFLCHPKPSSMEQDALWKKLIADELTTPETWETQLSAGKDKKVVWESLMTSGKLGGLALLRNLRNMAEVKVDQKIIAEALKNIRAERILPYRFIAAAKYAPWAEQYLEAGMFKSLDGAIKMAGRTALMIDVSGSMDRAISGKSDLTRIDAACGLAILLRELCADIDIYTFSTNVVQVPPRRGFALRDAILGSQEHNSTDLGQAVTLINSKSEYDRFIVISDEQSQTPVPNPTCPKSYMINVAAYKNGVSHSVWNHISGWSEAIVKYIQTLETY